MDFRRYFFKVGGLNCYAKKTVEFYGHLPKGLIGRIKTRRKNVLSDDKEQTHQRSTRLMQLLSYRTSMALCHKCLKNNGQPVGFL